MTGKHIIRTIFAGFILVVTATVIASINPSKASALSNTYFDNNDISGSAQVLLVNANTRYVKKSDGSIRVWFKSNHGRVTISNGHWCPGNTADTIETEDGSWGDFGNGSEITRFGAVGFPDQKWVGKKQPANCAETGSMEFTNIDDTENGYYYVDIRTRYVGDGSAGFGGVMNYFSISSSTPGALIGTQDNDEGYIATVEQINSSPANATYNIPFGAACNIRDGTTAALSFYDLDNDGGSGAQLNGKVSIQVRLKGTRDFKNFIGGIGNRWTPNSQDDALQRVSFVANKGEKYILEISNVYYNNTFQYSLPFSQIYYEDCGASPPPNCEDVGNCPSPDPVQRTMTVTPYIVSAGDTQVEIGTNLRFNQSAVVSGFPETHQWGYNEAASRRAVNSGQTASIRIPYDSVRGAYAENTSTKDVAVQRRCANGTQWAGNVDNCTGTGKGDAKKWLCKDGDFQKTCGNYDWRCVWTLPNPNSVRNVGWDPNAPGCNIYYFQCRNTAGTLVDDYRDWAGSSTTDRCLNRFKCPVPSTVRVLSANNSSPGTNCKIFYCAYESNTSDNWFHELDATEENRKHDAQCERRCSNGAGAKAPLRGEGDFNCYINPSFAINCTWSGNASGTSPTQTVTGNGTYCTNANSISVPTTAVARYCLYTTPNIGGWSSPPPGKGKSGNPSVTRAVWTVNRTPVTAGPACGQAGNRPYVKAFNGDVQSGTHVRYNTSTKIATCGTGNGDINTFNKDIGGYEGGATTNAVVAAGNVSGFRSATTLTQKGLTFANNDSSKVYGGAFGASNVACGEYTDIINQATNYASNTLSATTIAGNGYREVSPSVNGLPPIMAKITSPALTDGGTWVHTGNLYINGNVTYPAAAASIATLPGFKMIVLGNIYIDRSVTQLAGNYMAVDVGTVGGLGTGNIITCASAANTPVPVTGRLANCGAKLTVSGSLSAKSIKYLRVSGSVKDASNADTVTTTNAAEIINFGPEGWLPRGTVPRDVGNTYQSVTGLPPIL